MMCSRPLRPAPAAARAVARPGFLLDLLDVTPFVDAHEHFMWRGP